MTITVVSINTKHRSAWIKAHNFNPKKLHLFLSELLASGIERTIVEIESSVAEPVYLDMVQLCDSLPRNFRLAISASQDAQRPADVLVGLAEKRKKAIVNSESLMEATTWA